MLEEEGLDHVYERHARLARATQSGLQALGFQLFAQEGYRSNTVTSAVPPPRVEVSALRKLLDEKNRVVHAGGPRKSTGQPRRDRQPRPAAARDGVPRASSVAQDALE